MSKSSAPEIGTGRPTGSGLRDMLRICFYVITNANVLDMSRPPVAIHLVRFLAVTATRPITAREVERVSGLSYGTSARALHTLLGFGHVSEMLRDTVERRFIVTAEGRAVHAGLPADFRAEVERQSQRPRCLQPMPWPKRE